MMYYQRLGPSAVILCLMTQTAFAQTAEERAGARAAAEQGVKAFAEGRWTEASDLMARAEKLVHAPTHLLYLAQAEEKLGHLVVAHETYLKIIREKLAPNSPDVFFSAQEDAKKRADALRPRLSQVSIVVQGSQAGVPVDVTMDGSKVPEALVGVPHPVDPGEHQFEATAEGMQSGLSKVVLREGASETIVLTLQSTGGPSAAAEGNDARAPAGQPGANVTAGSTADGTSSSSGTHPLTIGGYIGLGVGAVGLGVGTVFAVRSSSLRSDADALCNNPDGTCPVANGGRIQELDDDADSAKDLALVGFVAGGVGVAAGITMLLLAPSSTEAQKSGFVAPYVAGNSAGIWGRF